MVLSTAPIRTLALAVAFGLAGSSVPAMAAVPSPSNSTLPGCFITSPVANFVSTVIVRDFSGNPVGNSLVVLDYTGCSSFDPCPQVGDPPDLYIVDPVQHTIRMFTNSQGVAAFALRAGGGCSGENIHVLADGVLLGSRRSASTDQDADHIVTQVDEGLLYAKIATNDLSGDLDCNGMVNEDDEFILVADIGLICITPLPARRSTWGQVKIRYR